MVWTGEHLEEAFCEAFPARQLRWLDARTSVTALMNAMSRRSDWLAFRRVDSESRMRLITALVMDKRLRGRVLLVHPTAHPGGWPVVHDHTEDLDAARASLAGLVKYPGRIAALLHLEPEAVALLRRVWSAGLDESELGRSLRQAVDPGVALAAAPAARHLVERDWIRFGPQRDGPVFRALTLDAAARRFWQRRMARRVEREHAKSTIASPATDPLAHLMAERELAEPFRTAMDLAGDAPLQARLTVETKIREGLSVLEQGAPDSDSLYALGLHALGTSLFRRAEFEEAESCLRRATEILEDRPDTDAWLLRSCLATLVDVLSAQGRAAETSSALARISALDTKPSG